MIVVGLDPSLTATGIASSEGWCKTVGEFGITKLGLIARIHAIDKLRGAILAAAGEADLYVIEVPAFSKAFGGSVERHALWWHVVRTLVLANIPVAEVTTNQRMRYATGKGMASKKQIIDAVARRWPMFETDGDDNMCDAAVLAAMGADWLGEPLADMPKSHRVALDQIAWPRTTRVAR